MPGADFARIFGTVLHRAESRAKSEEDKNNKAKQEDIDMYRKVLFDPNSSPEQRQKAADQITKLRGLNKKESPFGKLAGMLIHVSAIRGQKGAPGIGSDAIASANVPVASFGSFANTSRPTRRLRSRIACSSAA